MYLNFFSSVGIPGVPGTWSGLINNSFSSFLAWVSLLSIHSSCEHHSFPPSRLKFVRKYLESVYVPSTVLCMCYLTFALILTEKYLSRGGTWGFFFFSSLLGTRWGPADSARERGGMHLNMKRLGWLCAQRNSVWWEWLSYHQTDSIQRGVSPEIHAEGNSMWRNLWAGT